MSSPTVGIKDLLVAAEIGTYVADPPTAWNIVISRLTDDVDETIAVLDASGGKPNPAWLIDYPNVQILVRGTQDGYIATQQKCKDIKDALLGLPSQDVNGDRWVAINMIGDITPMGYDPKDRPLFSLNFALIIQPASTGSENRQPLP